MSIIPFIPAYCHIFLIILLWLHNGCRHVDSSAIRRHINHVGLFWNIKTSRFMKVDFVGFVP